MRFRTRRFLYAVVGFCVGTTVGYPIEHLLYERVYPFTLIAQLLGLH
jgi:hypothetical protein